MKKLILLHGISGSGKSTLIEKLIINFTIYKICSADYYWLRPDGVYDFNFRLLSNAHKFCQNNCNQYMVENIETILIDNTNLNFVEILFYLEMAKKYGYKVEIIEPQTDWRYNAEELAKRNTHKVPLATIQKMLGRKESLVDLQRKAKEFMDA